MARRLALVLLALLGGCVADAPEAPVLGNPKILVDRDATNATRIYVHSAFGERAYDRIALEIDNVTVAEQNDTYALVYRTADQDFHLRLEVESDGAVFAVEALVRPGDDGEDALVAVLADDGYEDLRPVGLPWEKLVEKRTEGEA